MVGAVPAMGPAAAAAVAAAAATGGAGTRAPPPLSGGLAADAAELAARVVSYSGRGAPLLILLSPWRWHALRARFLQTIPPPANANTQALTQRRDPGPLRLEAWLEAVLSTRPPPPPGAAADWAGADAADAADAGASATPALAARSLARTQLRRAGLGGAAADRLHRVLYVYSAGLADALASELRAAAPRHRAELLQCAWRAHLELSEAAARVAFESEWRALAGAAAAAVGELLDAKEALADVRWGEGGRGAPCVCESGV